MARTRWPRWGPSRRRSAARSLWLEQNRPAYWHEQIKRRREQVSMAKGEVFRKKLQKRPDYTPPMSEQMENLRKAEASLQEAEKRLTMVRKWQPRFQHAVLEFHATIQRLKDIAATDVPNAALLLGRIVESLEAYLRVQPPSGTGLGPGREPGRATPEMEAIATRPSRTTSPVPKPKPRPRPGPSPIKAQRGAEAESPPRHRWSPNPRNPPDPSCRGRPVNNPLFRVR